MAGPLKDARRERFCQMYFEHDGEMSDGAIHRMAGYKAKTDASAAASASEILKNPEIRARIAELQDESACMAIVKKSWVMRKLVENTDRAMQAEEVLDRKGEPTGEYVYQGQAANKALELLGTEIGMFERSQPTVVIHQVAMDYAEAQKAAELDRQAVNGKAMNGHSNGKANGRNGHTP
ncbi:MAG: terminase small subunit [Geminicoccaceae bacterium]